MTKYYVNKEKNFFLISILILPLIYIFFLVERNFIFLQDTQFIFDHYKYYTDYLNKYEKIILWIDEIRNGLNSFILFTYVGSLGLFFGYISSKFDINSYYSFLSLIYFYHVIIFYGIYLNLKNHRLNFYIFLILLILYLIMSSSFIALHFDLIFNISTPFIIYWSLKFFKNYRIINLTKIILIIFFQYSLFLSYTIIVNIYFAFFLFIFLFIFNFKSTFLSKVLFFNKPLDYIILIFSFLLLLSCKFFTDIFFNYFIFAPQRLGDFTVNFEVFRNYGKINFFEGFFTILTGSSIYFMEHRYYPKDIIFSLGAIFIIAYLYFLFKKKYDSKIEKNYIKLYLFVTSTLFIFSFTNIYIIDYFLYELPFFSYFRHKAYIVILAKPLIFFISYLFLLELIENKADQILVRKILNILLGIFGIIILFAILNHFFEFKNIKVKNLYVIPILFVNMILLFFLFFYKKKRLFLTLNYLLLPFFLIINLSPYIEKNIETKKIYDKIYIQNTINFGIKNDNCLKISDHKKKYDKLHFRKGSASYSSGSLVYDDYPCENYLRSDVGENKKEKINYSKFDNIEIRKINNEEYYLQKKDINLKNNTIKKSFSKNWVLKNNNNSLIENDGGFLAINDGDKIFKKYSLIYSNENLEFFAKIMIFIGFIFFCTILLSLISNIKKINTNFF